MAHASRDRFLKFLVSWTAPAALVQILAFSGEAAAQETVLIQAGDTWMYFKGTQAPPADWTQIAFNDASWLQGATGIGYGDNDDTTVLDDMMQTATQTGYMAFFARRKFTVANLATVDRLVLSIVYDDGFVAYLNGEEVARANIGTPGTAVAFDAAATAAREPGAAEIFNLSIAGLQQGTNVLAVELHNSGLTSSDASLIPRLLANGSIAPTGFTCALQAGQVVLSWSDVEDYDRILVLNNGIEIATLPGDATTYTDASPDTLDNEYQVVGVLGADEFPTAACNIACTQGALTCGLALVDGKTQATLSWNNTPAGSTGIDVSREGAPLQTLPGTATGFVDTNVESLEAEFDTNYTVVFRQPGGRTCTLTCGLSLCPRTLTARIVGGDVELGWGNIVKAWDHFEVSRNGVSVATNVPGDATSWTDTDIVLEVGESYTYLLHPIAVPGGEFEEPRTQCDTTVTVSYAPEVGSYSPPAGGWDYLLTFDGNTELQYNPNKGEKGNIDGNWIRSIDRDEWDGSGPEEVGLAPEGPAPGGIDVVSRPGDGACGTATSVLRILDPGDPSGAIGTTFPDPFDVPNNRRIVLGLDLGSPAGNLLKSGITLFTRIRTSPDAPAYMNPNPQSGDGAPFSHSVGQIGVYFRTPGGGGPNAGASFALESGGAGGSILFSSNPQTAIGSVGVNRFITIWMTVEAGAAADTYDINVYLNGSSTPSRVLSGTGLALQTGTLDFGANVANFIAIGFNGTGDDAMLDYDFIGYKLGVFAPTANPCSGGGTDFRRGDTNDDGKVNITDGIGVLNYLFLAGDTPTCLDSADSDDDGSITITDGIQILNFLFLGGSPPTPPGPETCGPDQNGGDDLDRCVTTQC